MTSKLMAEIKALSVDERLALVDEIWDSIAEPVALTAEQQAELDRRIAEYERNPRIWRRRLTGT